MDIPRNRFTVTTIFMAMLTAVVNLPALAIVKVNAFGMGFEHEQSWRRTTSGLSAPLSFARGILARLRQRISAAPRHALFRPAVSALIALIVFLILPGKLLTAPLLFGTLSEGRHAGEFLMGERSELGFPSRDNVTVLSGQTLKAGAVVGRVSKGIGRVSIPTVVAVGTANGTASAVFAGPEVQVGNYVVTCTAAATNAGTFSVVNPSGKTLPSATVGTAYVSREICFTLNDGSSDFVAGDVFTFVVSTTAPTVIGGTGSGVMTALSLGPDAKTGRYQVINRVVVADGGDFEVLDPNGDSVGRFKWAATSSTAAFTSRQVNFTLSDATDYIAGNYFDIAVFNQLSGGKVVAWDPTTFDGRDDVAGILYDNVDAASGDLAGVIIARDATVIKGSLEWAAAITSAQKESAYLDMAARGIIAR